MLIGCVYFILNHDANNVSSTLQLREDVYCFLFCLKISQLFFIRDKSTSVTLMCWLLLIVADAQVSINRQRHCDEIIKLQER